MTKFNDQQKPAEPKKWKRLEIIQTGEKYKSKTEHYLIGFGNCRIDYSVEETLIAIEDPELISLVEIISKKNSEISSLKSVIREFKEAQEKILRQQT